MNILLIVFAFISAIGLITYAQLAHLRELGAVRREYACILQVQEQAAFIQAQRELYEKDVVLSKKGGDQDRILAYRGLNLYPLLSGGEGGERSRTIELLFKNLLEDLYADQPFYAELKAERPHFVDELIQKLKSALQEEKVLKVDKAAFLSNLELHDAQLQYVLALILRGTPKECGEEGVSDVTPFLLMEKTDHPIRMQLTSKEILLAIYGRSALVDEIDQKRRALRKAVKNGNMTKEEASQLFEEAYRPLLPQGVDAAFFNFNITKTNIDKK